MDSFPFDILVAHGVKEVTPLVKRFALPDEKPMCALYDHDKAGVSAVKGLLQNEFTDIGSCPNHSVNKYKLLAMTLPPPKKHGGVNQAENLNLVLEFYFPDTALCEIHERSGGKLFSDTHYVIRGEHKENYDDFREITLSSMKFKLLKQEGKKYLVDNLKTMNDEDFSAFHDLFKIIAAHLQPSLELKRTSDTAGTQLDQESLAPQ